MTVVQALAVLGRNAPNIVHGTHEEVVNAAEYDNALKIIGEAITARVISKEEICEKHIVPEVVYIEIRGDTYAYPVLYNWLDFDHNKFYFNDLAGDGWCLIDSYGRTWRLWENRKPTDREMEEVVWE